VKTKDIAYDADGAHMIGYFAVDDGRPGKRPGVLIAHSGPGLSEHAKGRARALAELGYAAFAMDYHGGGVLLAAGDDIYARINAYMANGGIRLRAQAALDVLSSQQETDVGQLAAIGYCFGGTTVLELARSGAPLAAVVGFHSGLDTRRPEDARNVKGKILVCLGSEDPIIPPEQRLAFEREMREGGVDWQMHLFGGAEHSFTDPGIDALAKAAGMSGMRYHQPSDERSWRLMRDMFVEVFGPEAQGTR
jgi:dienelactone hydrolase